MQYYESKKFVSIFNTKIAYQDWKYLYCDKNHNFLYKNNKILGLDTILNSPFLKKNES